MKAAAAKKAIPPLLYHIAEPDAWHTNGSDYLPDGFAKEGFIHLSTQEQLRATAERYYAKREDMLVLVIDVAALEQKQNIVFENLLGGDESFPHLYAPLPRSAVLSYEPLRRAIEHNSV